MTHPIFLEFHVSRQARDRYQFDDSLFQFTGNVIFGNFHAARLFAQKMNDKRDLISFPERAVQAGQINAMGLIDEILHLLLQEYRQRVNPQVMANTLAWLEAQVGANEVELTLQRFGEEFPPLAVYRREITLGDYMAGSTTDSTGRQVAHRELMLEELLMLWLANANPAFSPYRELFDDSTLEKGTHYREMYLGTQDYFAAQPRMGAESQDLFGMLRAPALTSPHSLTGQLEFLRTHWTQVIEGTVFRLLRSQDLIKEEEKIVIGVGGGVGVPAQVIEFAGLEAETEAFSPDRDWMPDLVMMAKNSYVWLDQLSTKYKKPITTLDQIPDEELDSLSRAGFTGLWLIGLWERSQASKTIKQMRGNPDAVASAYSLFGYEIAADLGGDTAYQELRERAGKYGIRLASDMVPNHMGIDSRWLVEHPDWFVSLPYSPFPSYTFNGVNLSWDERVGIYLEDHYFDNSDAAVVFKRVDSWTGNTQYIYHGNDGTSMPWNDTAQLNYLLPEVREAVIQTILEVARMFPVIRFDAAMTLAKRHYQRLWYPEPGSGGDIPSRAEHGLTKEQFDSAIPTEFWREVVDRVAAEVPDTLLLAEAFWLMEGYFVRTLGMHRVYNSAFMNMMRDEKNQEYRQVIKNTLEFDPEILKRYVNFMNNPDERTAVDQFGKGDKYFGICTLLATFPGLPMFGHGQLEGFTEKYGMEYRRAYYDEQPDAHLVARHQQDIFPLLRKRYLFADAQNFLLYDFFTQDGSVNEDVYAYSNQYGSEHSLVFYHNKYATARGWIRTSAAYPVKTDQGDERTLVQKTLAEGLGLPNDAGTYLIFKDQSSGMEFLRNCRELHERGMYIELSAYQSQVFLDLRTVVDTDWHQYAQLAAYLAGRGVPSVDEALRELFLQPIHAKYRELVSQDSFEWLYANRLNIWSPVGDVDAETETESLLTEISAELLDEVQDKTMRLMAEARRLSAGSGDAEEAAVQVVEELAAILALPALDDLFSELESDTLQEALAYLLAGPGGKEGLAESGYPVWGALFAWVFSRRLGCLQGESVSQVECAQLSRTLIDEWLLGKLIARTQHDLGLDDGAAWRSVDVVRLLTEHSQWYLGETDETLTPTSALNLIFRDSLAMRYLGVNRYQGVLWFNQESFQELAWWLFAACVVQVSSVFWDEDSGSEQLEDALADLLDAYAIVREWLAALEISEYQVDKLLQALK